MLRIGQSVPRMFPSFEKMTKRNWNIPGCCSSSHAPPLTHLPLASRRPGTSCSDGFIACSLSHGRTDTRRWFSAHAVPSRMTRSALPLISGRLWKATIVERSPRSCSPSQTGRRRENFLGLSVMFLPQMIMRVSERKG